MTKYAYILQNGYKWRTPAEAIAESYADNYKEDGYDEQFEYAINDESVLYEWLQNNMNIDELELELVKEPNQKEPELGEDYELEFGDE